MNTNECMEYSQKYANAQGSKDRNEARGELRKHINLTVAAAVAAERERCAALCKSKRKVWDGSYVDCFETPGQCASAILGTTVDAC